MARVQDTTEYTPRSLLHGMLLMSLAMACFGVMNVLIRMMADELPSLQLVFMRNMCSVALMLPWMLRYGLRGMKTERLSRHVWRAAVGIGAMEAWFYAVYLMPVNDSTAISFMTPIFVTILAVIFFGERIGVWRIGAIFCGFLGVMVITQPSHIGGLSLPVLIVLSSSLLMAIAGVLVKSLSRTDPPWRIVSYMALFMTLFSALPGIWVWQTPQLWHLAAAGMIGLLSTVAQICMAASYSRAPMVVLVPFDFTRLLFTALFAWLLIGEIPGANTWIGAVMIVGSTLIISWRESRAKRVNVTAAPSPQE